MLDRRFFSTYVPTPAPLWRAVVGGAFRAQMRHTGTTTALDGLERLPREPALICTNSSQKYDFMPLRCDLDARGVRAVTITKGKNYHSLPFRFLLRRLGVIPLASRGYLLAVDFQSVLGRRPTEEEYRALRDHLDRGAPLPATPALDALRTRDRALLGHDLALRSRDYRVALREVYAAVMAESLRLCREAMSAGYHVQIYPEGTVSSRLGVGRPGAVQFAWALGASLVPAGMSGCREAFAGQGLGLRGGPIVVRFGEPYRLPPGALPADYRPFHPDDEAAHQPALQQHTGELMTRIDALLDPAYRRAEGLAPDGTQGVRRFL
jgi:1-acyl-sn-glycerol-3-phosphate acyltransferase